MGQIADDMVNGDVCIMCGQWLKGSGYGVPRACSNTCARDYGAVGIRSDGALVYDKKDILDVVNDRVDISL